MSAKPVQISIDRKLLDRVDRDPQTKKEGRSAFIRDAIELYLAAKRRRATDARIVAAYRGTADKLRDEVEPWIQAQVWPTK